MNKFNLAFLIAVNILFSICITNIITTDIPKIDVYYESLCPYCEGFIGDSFKTYFSKLGHEKIANITFIPYGNAQEVQQGSKYVYTCQHGPDECTGNVFEACAKSKMSSEQFHGFLICVKENIELNKRDFTVTTKFCTNDDKLASDITTCAYSGEGNALQHEAALQTNSLDPPHKYVPWIVVNGKYDPNTGDQIVDDLFKYICKTYSDIPVVKEVCGNINNNINQPTSKVLKFLEQ